MGSQGVSARSEDDRPLTTISKEFLQQFGASSRQNAPTDLHAMIQTRMIQHLNYRVHRACFGVIRTVNQTFKAGMHQCPGAHCARFNCSKELAVAQAMVTDVSSSLAQGDDLGVSAGIALSKVTVPASAHDLIITDNDRTYRHFSCFEGTLGSEDGLVHPYFVGRQAPLSRRWTSCDWSFLHSVTRKYCTGHLPILRLSPMRSRAPESDLLAGLHSMVC
jgi:hypothetical protein